MISAISCAAAPHWHWQGDNCIICQLNWNQLFWAAAEVRVMAPWWETTRPGQQHPTWERIGPCACAAIIVQKSGIFNLQSLFYSAWFWENMIEVVALHLPPWPLGVSMVSLVRGAFLILQIISAHNTTSRGSTDHWYNTASQLQTDAGHRSMLL